MPSPFIAGPNPQQNKLCDMVPAARMLVESTVCRLYDEGASIRDVKSATGLAITTIHKILRRHGRSRSYKDAYALALKVGRTRMQRKRAKQHAEEK